MARIQEDTLGAPMPKKRTLALSRAADAGKKDPEGFRAPDVGAFDTAVRVRESSAAEVAVDGVAAGDLRPWSAVLVWDETGVRTGKRAGLWAVRGTLTAAFVLPAKLRTKAVAALTAAVVEVLSGYVPRRDLSVARARILLDGAWIGLVEVTRAERAAVCSLALHIRPDLSKAKGDVAEEQGRVIDHATKKLPTDWQLFGAINTAFARRLREG